MSALLYAYAMHLRALSLPFSSVERACRHWRPSQHPEEGGSLVQSHVPITQHITLIPSNMLVLTLGFDETDGLNPC